MASTLFAPLELSCGIALPNRIAMAPMVTYAGNVDATFSDLEAVYYRRRVRGPGLVITGSTHILPNGIGYANELGVYDDRFIEGLSKLAGIIRGGGAKAILQIYHAGSKAIAALSPSLYALTASGIPSSMPEAGPAKEMTEREIDSVIYAFGEAARRAAQAGFDGVEIHGAHGFLLQNFLSKATNHRRDQYGGSSNGRMAFPLAVVDEVQRAASKAGRPFAVGYRFSPEEHTPDGLGLADTFALLDALIARKIDYVHASLYHYECKPATWEEPAPDGLLGLLAERVDGRVPLIAAGGIRTLRDAEAALARGLDVVAMGSALLMNPDWVQKVESGRGDAIRSIICTDEMDALDLPPQLQNMLIRWDRLIDHLENR